MTNGLVVLFCPKSAIWKITDFGLTREGTSWKVYPTPQAGGTDGYRAPELVKKDPRKREYCQQTDIFALGCIIYQLAFDRQPFLNDIAVYQFEMGELPTVPRLIIEPRLATYVSQFINSMIQVVWWQRPNACDIIQALRTLTDDLTVVHIPSSLGLFESDNEPRPTILIDQQSNLWKRIIWRTYW